jgi:hypothetical protein
MNKIKNKRSKTKKKLNYVIINLLKELSSVNKHVIIKILINIKIKQHTDKIYKNLVVNRGTTCLSNN